MQDALQLILRDVRDDGVAVPFATLVLRLRQMGTAVTEGVLERRLRAEDSGVRLLDPWRGPQAALRGMISDTEGAAGLWVVAEDDRDDLPETPGSAGAPGLLRALRCLGRGLDERSSRDVARWIGLVEEARRLRRPAA